MKKITKAYNKIAESEVFRRDGAKIDLPAALIALGNAVHEYDGEIDWSLGEHNEASLDSLIVGAYWSCTEWHAGQSSDSYAALCTLGSVFSPSCTCTPDEESPEFTAYELCNQWFAENAATATH